ncbi:MAG: DUF1449 family protein [Planctomycetota bacterium]|nr:DUF1449 family protein [Planctomycetota bacterium]
MNLDFFLQSFNWVFIFPIGLATLFITLQVLGFGLSVVDADVDVDADIDADVDIDVDVDADLDLDVDADGDLDLDAGDAGVLLHFLSWFHVGKVPFSILLSLFFYAFGFGGLFATTYLRKSHGLTETETLLGYAFPIALLIAAVMTKSFGGILGRLVPSYESKRMNVTRLIGQIAQVDSVKVDHETGRGHVKDKEGDIHTVFLRLLTAEEGSVAKGGSVRLLRYKAKERHFLCRALTEQELAESAESK